MGHGSRWLKRLGGRRTRAELEELGWAVNGRDCGVGGVLRRNHSRGTGCATTGRRRQNHVRNW